MNPNNNVHSNWDKRNKREITNSIKNNKNNNKEINFLKNEINRIKEVISRIIEQIEQTSLQLEISEKVLADNDDFKTSINNKIDNNVEEISGWYNKLAEIISEMKNTQKENFDRIKYDNSSIMKSIVKLDNQVEEIKNTNSISEKEIENLRYKYDKLNDYEDFKEVVDKFMISCGNVDDIREDVANLSLIQDAFEDKTKEEIETLNNNIYNINKQSTQREETETEKDLKEAVSTLTEVMEAMSDKLSEMEEENTSLKLKISELEYKISNIRKATTNTAQRKDNSPTNILKRRGSSLLNRYYKLKQGI